MFKLNLDTRIDDYKACKKTGAMKNIMVTAWLQHGYMQITGWSTYSNTWKDRENVIYSSFFVLLVKNKSGGS